MPKAEEMLTAGELAGKVGRSAKRVRAWMLQGIGGVILRNVWVVNRRLTCLRWYKVWRRKVARRHEELRQQRLATVPATSRKRKARAARVDRELKAMGGL